MLRRVARRIAGESVLRPLMEKVATSQVTAQQLARSLYLQAGRSLRVLDLGCGAGASSVWFSEIDRNVEWHGVDIEESPEVRARVRVDARMVSFDGITLPYPADHFDMIYSNQVFEHVRRPYELMAEVRRVLKPSGLLVGSVAYLEPYHSYSIFNFTPFGMLIVMKDAGLQPVLLRHSSDAFFKILRQLIGGQRWVSALSRFSILYGLISLLGRASFSDVEDINLLKIQFSSEFCFVGKR